MANALDRIADGGVVAIIRASERDQALRMSEVLIDSGMPIVEITFTVPGAVEVIGALRRSFPELLVGAGTVIDATAARLAILEGAQFLVSVVASRAVIALGHRFGTPVIPGASPHRRSRGR